MVQMVDSELILRKTPELQIGILKKLCEGHFSQKQLIEKLEQDGVLNQKTDYENKKKSVSRAVGILRKKELVEYTSDERYHDDRTKRIKLKKDGIKSILNIRGELIWNCIINYSLTKPVILTFFNSYYEKNRISKTLINRFGSATMLDLLKYIKIREPHIWKIDGKDCKEKAISILKDYAIKRKDKLKVDGFHYFTDKLEQKLFDERLIYYHTIKGKTDVTISIFGILFLIVNLTDNDEIENIIKHNPDKLPFVFDNKIWSDIKELINNKTKLSLSTIIKEIFMQGFTRTFDNSFRYTQLNHLNKLYQVEYDGYSKLVKLWKNGLDIFNSLAEKNQCKTDFQDYLLNIGDIPDSFKKFENSCLQFKILNNIISEREQFSFPPDMLPKIDDDEQNIIMMPILESISFHFYAYLQTLKLTEKEWEYFLNNNPNVKEFLDRWNQEIEKSSIKLIS